MLIALTLMTTISYNTYFTVYAEIESQNNGEQTQQTEQTNDQNAEKKEQEATEQAGQNKTEDGANDEATDSTQTEKTEDANTNQVEEVAGKASKKSKTPTMPDVTSSSYIVISGSTSEVVLQHHSDRKMAPGKITSLVTAMVVIDNMYNDCELDNSVTITKKLSEYGNTFQLGDKITVRDLLTAMLVGGDGQAAECLASYSASKRSIFIKEMNSKALELELLDTHFTNPSGSYNTKQYSSAADCAKIAQAAQRYKLIKEAFEVKSSVISVLNGKQSRQVTVRATNPLLVGTNPADKYENIDGGILGTLNEPKTASQYAGIATIDDMQFIVILMDSSRTKVAYEAQGLFEYANTKVTRNTIVKAGKRVGSVRIRGGAKTKVGAYTETKGFVYVPPEGSDDLITTEVVLYKDLNAPLSKGDKVGEFRIKVADELKGTVDLVIKDDVEPGWILSNIYISNFATIIIGAVIFAIFLLWLRIIAVKRRRKRLKAARRQRKLRELARQQAQMDEDREARNWNYAPQDYEPLPPRTTDIRKAAINEAMEAEKGSTTKL